MPTLERARIAWRKPDAYDDWDEIVGTLYKSIVIRSIECSFPDEPVLSFPRYGLLYEQYPDVSFIDVCPEPGNIEGFLLFFGFDTIDIRSTLLSAAISMKGVGFYRKSA